LNGLWDRFGKVWVMLDVFTVFFGAGADLINMRGWRKPM
jgi:hypothetical protein